MARTTPSPVGPWPAPLPIGSARASAWLDGTTASAAIAHWLTAEGLAWLALVDADAPLRARTAALATADRLGAEATLVSPEGPVTDAVGWAKAARAARQAGTSHLVLPSRTDAAVPPLPLRLHAAETALTSSGLAGLWAPLLNWEALETFRLALALGVPFAETWDCAGEPACGRCDGCVDRARAFKQLGMPDPVV